VKVRVVDKEKIKKNFLTGLIPSSII